MTRRNPFAWSVVLAPWLLGCGAPPAGPGGTRRLDFAGGVARVGTATVSRDLVGHVAYERRIPVVEALRAVVEDQLFAAEARSRGLDRNEPVRWALRATLARRLALELFRAARDEGPPRDDELGFRRVVHAVVVRSASVTSEEASALAAAVEREVSGASTAEDFLARARAVPHDRVRIVAQYVGPFDAAGHAPDAADTGTIDPTFVAASFRLRGAGQTSGVVETSFGWHVIRLVADEPCTPSDRDRRRRDLAEDVVGVRARVTLADLLRARQERAPVRVEAGADASLARAALIP